MKDTAEGEGDLTQRVEVNSTDEVGQLRGATNAFIDKIQGMLVKVRTSVEAVASASEEAVEGGEAVAETVEAMTQIADKIRLVIV